MSRCHFCGHKLDAAGLCQNQKCADYIRTQIIEKDEAAKATETATTSTTTTADSTSATA